MKELYRTGLILFSLGSLMLFLHRLIAEAVRFDSGISETLHFNLFLYIPSLFFIIIGLILMVIFISIEVKKKRPGNN
ncbi:hypothetical protein SFC08_10660 [Lysinibacillus halotolerans]